MEETQEEHAGVSSPPPGRAPFSSNWRNKDPTPRAESSPRPYQNQRNFAANRQNSGGQPRQPEANPGTRLYVGNLLYSAGRPDVESLFVESGFQISGLSMSVDPFTGRNPSYAFVDFETAEEAQRAMDEVNGKELLGRPVNVRPGVRKSEQGEGFERRVKDYSGRGSPRESGGQVNNYSPSFNRWTQPGEQHIQQQSSQQGLRLYVGNLPRIEPQGALEAEIQQLFAAFQITAVSKLISPHPSKIEEEAEGNFYYCFVDLQTPEEVQMAVDETNGKQGSWGGEMRVGKARDNRDRKAPREGGAARENGGYERRGPPRALGEGRWR